MKNAVHQYEDKLLEFAYGELPQHEADAVDAHVRGCARCSQSLSEIRGVRATMAQLPMTPAPDVGLDSLLAYAEQAAKRNAQTQVKPSLFKRFLMPLASVMALATVGVIAWRANQEFDTSPAAAAADAKADEYASRLQKKEELAKEQSEFKSEPEGRKNEAPAPATVPTELAAAQQQANDLPSDDRAGGEAYRDANKKLEAKKDTAPQATTRSSVTKVSREPAQEKVQDWSNTAKRGALRESDGAERKELQQKSAEEERPMANAPVAKTPAPAPPPADPKPAPAKAQDKAIFGLGTGAETGADTSSAVVGGSLGDLGTGEGKAKKRAKAEGPAPVAAAPSTPAVPQAVAPNSAPPPKQAPGKGSLSIGTMGRGGYGTSAPTDEDASLETTDSLRVDNDAKFSDRRRQASVTQSLESARVASNQGDRLSEVKLLLEVLKNGPTGYQKVETLKRLCDALEALGEFDRADPYCDQLLSEFPGTAAAQAITQRRNATQRVPARPSPAAERSKKSLDEVDSKKAAPAEQQQQAVPAQAY